MELTRVWRRAFAAVRSVAAIVAAVAFFATTLAPALAGTTGVIHGTVTDASGAPIAAVAVSLTAPSGTYHATTDAKGYYSLAGIYADTYTASFTKAGYDSSEVTGVTVFADQSITVDTKLTKSLKTIAKVTARSAASAFQPEQTTDTYQVNAQQIQNLQGSQFNVGESGLIASLPGVSFDSSGYPVIHGGRENEEGFQFEGIPYTDAYTNQFVNTLALPGNGVASAQLTPGIGDASVQSNGTGTINLVAKRGTYPGAAHFGVRLGGPAFDHQVNADLSLASPNGAISDYASFSGSNNGRRYGHDQYAYPLIARAFSTSQETDREFLNNLIFRFGKNHNQTVQLFADVAQHNFYGSAGGLLGCFNSCNPYFTSVFGGVEGLSAAQIGQIYLPFPGQSFPGQTLLQANRTQNAVYQPNEAYKVAYTLNINPSTYLSADFYSVNSISTFDTPNAATNSIGVGDSYGLQGGHSIGGQFRIQKQLNEKNLLDIGYEYAWRHGEEDFVSSSYGWYSYLINNPTAYAPLDFVNPSDPGCIATYGPGVCGYAYGPNAGANSGQLYVPPFNIPSNLQRRDQSFYINDKITFNDNLNVSLGLRDEKADFVGLPTPQLQSDCTFLYNPASAPANPNYDPGKPLGAGNCPFTPNFSNITNKLIHPNVLEPRVGISWQVRPDTALRFTYERAATFPLLAIVDARVSQGTYSPYNNLAPYSLFNSAVLGLPTNLYAIPTVGGQSGTNVASCGFAPYNVPCTTYGQELLWANQNFQGVPYQPVLPMVANNYTFTVEHQFTKGLLNGVAFSVAPWIRHQYDTEASIAQPLLNANGTPQIINGQVVTGPSVATNLGKEFADGVDVNITRESALGLSGQWTMSYVNEFSSVPPTSVNEDFFPSIPTASALAGNVYRVGFLSPFTTTLALTYKTKSGWRINPRFTYDIGYPVGVGTLTPAIINGAAVNVPNTNVFSASSATGTYSFVDPLNPGSVFNPNVVSTLGTNETSSAGGKLTKPDFYADLTIEYAPPKANYTIGFNVSNVFDKLYEPQGVTMNRYQPLGNGLAGPLTGYSTHSLDYQLPYANPQILPQFGGNGVYYNMPRALGRTYYVYYSVKV